MTDTMATAAGGPAPAPSGLLLRWSDRLNPILVREVQQALKGRAFALLVLVAVLFSIGLALGVASDDRPSQRAGQLAFSYGLLALVPLVLFVVPLQAYQSMRLELRAGIVEQLLLSRLRPRRIVAGKLAAAMVQYFLYLSVLAPVLSTTYLLRGVDLPTIAVCLLFSLLFCVGATALAIAAAAQGTVPALQPLANLGMTFALGAATLGLMAGIGSGDLVRELGRMMRSPEWVPVLAAVVLATVMVTVLAAMIASALLAHSYENRGTPFRIFLLALTALGYGWMLAFLPRSEWPQAGQGLTLFLLGAGAVTGLFFVSENAALSPRVRAMVPRSRLLALLLAPLLPGRDRGCLFLGGYFALLGAVFLLCQRGALVFGRKAGTGEWLLDAGAFLLAYVVVYLLLVKIVRGLLPESTAGSHAARLSAPLLLLLACGLPILFDALFAGGHRGWHPGHVLNPFATMDHFVGRTDGSTLSVLAGLSGFAAALLALQAPALVRGLDEVLAAAGQRARGGGRGT